MVTFEIRSGEEFNQKRKGNSSRGKNIAKALQWEGGSQRVLGGEEDSVSLRQSVTERGKGEEAKRWTEARAWQTEEEGRNVQVQLHSCPLWGVEGQGKMATRVGKETGFED